MSEDKVLAVMYAVGAIVLVAIVVPIIVMLWKLAIWVTP